MTILCVLLLIEGCVLKAGKRCHIWRSLQGYYFSLLKNACILVERPTLITSCMQKPNIYGRFIGRAYYVDIYHIVVKLELVVYHVF